MIILDAIYLSSLNMGNYMYTQLRCTIFVSSIVNIVFLKQYFSSSWVFVFSHGTMFRLFGLQVFINLLEGK